VSISFNTKALELYLKDLGWDAEGLEVNPLVGGQSNPTYKISSGNQHAVLRKKPTGKLLPSAHAIDREYRVMQALSMTEVPVPKMLSYCEDESVIGTPFTIPIPEALLKLIEWLPHHIPADDETTLVHGDFRLDNMVFDHKENKVIGVLDWELSTLGHPMADFSYQCMAWRIPPSLWRGIGGLDLVKLGIPTEKEYIEWYETNSGRTVNSDWNFYMAYNFFRIAAILHGVAQRAVDGNASASDARENGQKAGLLAEIGMRCVGIS